jgi:tRNA threonylcarbamoyladenosine biosynthesis protein TsaE
MSSKVAMRVCQLADAGATAALGRELARELLAAAGRDQVPMLLLQGDLGAGKTCLVQGLAVGLGIEEPITSPTFALAQHYGGRLEATSGRRSTALVHLDLYRLEQSAAADELFLEEEEQARALGAVLAVEWPERLSFCPDRALVVQLAIEAEGRRAQITSPWVPPPASPGRLPPPVPRAADRWRRHPGR